MAPAPQSSSSSSNRLVFCSIQGKSSKRKVAVPITPSTTWPEFVETVCRKLKLGPVGDGIELFVGDQVLQSLDQLEDIAEVAVRDGRGGGGGGSGSGSGGSGIDAYQNGHGVLLADGSAPAARASPFSGVSGPERTASSTKYVKKQSDVALALGRIQSVFAGAGGQHDAGAGQSLPVTTRKLTPMGSDLTPIEQVKRRMKKRRRSVFDPRTLLAVFSVLSVAVMMLFVYMRVVGGGAVVEGLGGGRKVLPGGA